MFTKVSPKKIYTFLKGTVCVELKRIESSSRRKISITSRISRWIFFLTFIQPSAIKVQKTVKHYKIQIAPHNLVIFKRRGIFMVPVLELMYIL
jgi:hypothetical protein